MSFSNRSLLLSGGRAASFYQKGVAALPLVARVSRELVRALAEDLPIETLTQLWLADPHKRALLRHAGTEETFVCGAGSDYEKFAAFAAVIQDMTGNNAKLQCHAELQLLFDCELTLCDTHKDAIWQATARILSEQGMRYRALPGKCHIEALLCSAAPTDDLADFAAVESAHPVFCPDVYLEPNNPDFISAVNRLCQDEVSFPAFLTALSRALDRFASQGCHAAVHHVLPTAFCRPNEYHAAKIFEKALRGEALCEEERALYAAQLWRFLGREYVRRDILLELPMEGAFALQNVENRHTVCEKIAPEALLELFDYLQGWEGLARTVFYLSAPWQAPVLAAIAARYPTKVEGGPQFSFGIVQGSPAENRARLQALANAVPLSYIAGAFSDQRLPTSLLDGELFRRTLCSMLAEWEEYGELELPQERTEALLRRVCFENAKRLYQI